MTINLRASEQVRDLIDQAAAALGKSRSEFMLDCAQERAEEVLLDQSVFVLDDARFEAFRRLLASAPSPHKRLRDLIASKPPWDE